MTNKILGLSIFLVVFVGALSALTPTLLSNESNIVYAQEQQLLQTGAADDPMKRFSGAD
jgi:uncharacterized membrane protein